MKVICKSTKGFGDSEFLEGSLKVGREYEVLEQIQDPYLEYMVMNDYGFEHFYPETLFVSKQELREEKLNELGI